MKALPITRGQVGLNQADYTTLLAAQGLACAVADWRCFDRNVSANPSSVVVGRGLRVSRTARRVPATATA